MKRILVINPGSTSTKLALYDGETLIKEKNIEHNTTELNAFPQIMDQFHYRLRSVLDWMALEGIRIRSLDAVAGRGGLLRPLPGGTYRVTGRMLEDLRKALGGEHASNLGAFLAKSVADRARVSAYIVDPVAVDEFEELARFSGSSELGRRCQSHALNIKAVARQTAEEIGKKLNEVNFVVAHLGGGISVAALKKGRIIDVNNANQEGPFSPERTGGLPVGPLVHLAFSGQFTYEGLKKKISGQGGLMGYFGTHDVREVEKLIAQGDEKAKLVYDAMTYQVSKEIAAMSTVLMGDLEGIILTGGIARSEMFTSAVIRRTAFISDVFIKPGTFEMKALAMGVLRVLTNQEDEKIYEEEVYSSDQTLSRNHG